MDPAEHLLFHQAKLLARGELPLAGVAGEAGQVVGIALGASHPVAGVDLPSAAGTLGAEPTVREGRAGASTLCCRGLQHPTLTTNQNQCRPQNYKKTQNLIVISVVLTETGVR